MIKRLQTDYDKERRRTKMLTREIEDLKKRQIPTKNAPSSTRASPAAMPPPPLPPGLKMGVTNAKKRNPIANRQRSSNSQTSKNPSAQGMAEQVARIAKKRLGNIPVVESETEAIAVLRPTNAKPTFENNRLDANGLTKEFRDYEMALRGTIDQKSPRFQRHLDTISRLKEEIPGKYMFLKKKSPRVASEFAPQMSKYFGMVGGRKKTSPRKKRR